MENNLWKNSGNGKIDRTPHPLGLRKIKIVSVKVFESLKELVSNGNKLFKSITPRGNREKSQVLCKEPVFIERQEAHEYEPSPIDTAYEGLRWRWRRVTEWHRYIDDPIEKYKGTHDNLV